MDTAIPRAARYQGLETLYAVDESRLADSDLVGLLRCDLVQPEGALDLWVLGAVLFAARHPQKVLAAIPFARIVEAAKKFPMQTAFLFLASRQKTETRREWAGRLAEAASCQPYAGSGLLAAGDDLGAQPYLRAHLPEVARALFALESEPGFRLSQARHGQAVKALVKAALDGKVFSFLLEGTRGALAHHTDRVEDTLASLDTLMNLAKATPAP